MASSRPCGGPQRPRLRGLARLPVDDGPLRPGEELIPGAVERALPVHEHRVPGRPGERIPQRERAEDRGDLPAVGRGEAVQGRDRRVPQHPGQGPEGVPRGRGLSFLGDPGRTRGPGLRRGPLEQPRAVAQGELDVLAEWHLDGCVMPPPGERVPPRLHREVPQAFGGDGHLGAVPVDARGQLPHRRERAPAAVRPAQHDAGPEHLVSLAEDGGTDLERLPGDGPGGTLPAGYDGLHVDYGNPADHLGEATLLRPGSCDRLAKRAH